MTTHGRGSNTESSHSFHSIPFLSLFALKNNKRKKTTNVSSKSKWMENCLFFFDILLHLFNSCSCCKHSFCKSSCLNFGLYLFPGMGYASQLILFYGCISYIVILAWAFLYLFSSFSWDLPWASCNNTWNTGSVRVPYTARKLCNEKKWV